MGLLSCQTAPGLQFETLDDLKAHYHTDWHRYNLKRKVAGLPMLTQGMFDRVVNQTLSLAKAVEDAPAHVSARDARRRARLAKSESDASEDDSGGESEWEELSGDEAAAAMEEIAVTPAPRRRLATAGRAQRGEPSGASAASDAEMEDDDDLDDDTALALNPGLRLAANGFELVANRKVLGSRDLARYYRQRHRPTPQPKALISSREAAERSTALALAGRKEAPRALTKGGKTEIEVRDERVRDKRQARKELMVGMSASGPMFRGYRVG